MRPTPHRTLFTLALLVTPFLTAPLLAQQQPGPGLPNPHLLTVLPLGGKVGSTVELTLTGQDFDDAQTLLFSQPGFKAELIPTPAPDPKKPGPRTPTVKFKVSIPADASLGIHDVRLVSKLGVSNPRAFVVGDLDEVLETEPNNDVDQAQKIEINTTINGVISTPTDVDYFTFKGKKGQRVVISCLSSSVDSRLAAAVELYRKTGGRLAFNRDYNGSDALLDCILPEDDDYFVRVFAFAYTQGGPDHFYRLTITTAPWIDAVYPPVVEGGKQTEVTVYGRNLPGGKPDPTAVYAGSVLEKITVTVTPPKDAAARQRLTYSGHVAPRSSGLDGFEYRVKNASGWSNPFLLTFALAPIVLDNEDNDTPDKAQEVNVPCTIAGRIEKKHDRDWYKFTVKKGDVYSIEAYGDRLGSPVDLYFTVRSADGKNVVEFDDNPDVLNPTQFFTRSDDPARYRFVAPADGSYLLQISSREADVQAGPRDLYAVRIVPEQPDFRLVVMPPSPTLPDAAIVRPGSAQYYTVLAWRQDGYNGEIALSAEGLPKGVTCPPNQFVGPGQKQATLVVVAAADAEPWTGTIRVKGTATVGGKKVEREARPATISWAVPQLNIPAIARLDRELLLAVREGTPYHLVATAEPASVSPGDKVQVKVKVEKRSSDLKVPIQLAVLNLPPQNLIAGPTPNQPLQLAADKDEATLTLDIRPNLPPGEYTFVVRGQATVQLTRDAANGNRQKVNSMIAQPSLPFTITVVPKEKGTK